MFMSLSQWQHSVELMQSSAKDPVKLNQKKVYFVQSAIESTKYTNLTQIESTILLLLFLSYFKLNNYCLVFIFSEPRTSF